MIIVRTLLAALTLGLSAAACSSIGGVPPEASPIVAEVNGKTITLAELDARIAPALYEARAEALEQIVGDLVLETEAERRGLSVDDLVEQEVAALGDVDDAEVQAFFDANRSRMGGDVTLEAVAGDIRRFLEQGRRSQALSQLREAADVELSLEPPRAEVAATGPSRGNADAPVTIVEFSDYQCPFCGRAEPTVAQVLERYPDQVRFVYRHFPLDSIHPQARAAAIAATCAAEQDRFWQYHEMIFSSPRDLSAERLALFADELELDRAAFDACIASPRAARVVSEDLAAGKAAGTTGTPAFFINGIKLSGARPVEDFVELIEAELAREGGA